MLQVTISVTMSCALGSWEVMELLEKMYEVYANHPLNPVPSIKFRLSKHTLAFSLLRGQNTYKSKFLSN